MSWDFRNLFNVARRTKTLSLGQKATLNQHLHLQRKEVRTYFAEHIGEHKFKRYWFERRLPTKNYSGVGKKDHPNPIMLWFSEIERRPEVVLQRACLIKDVFAATSAITAGDVLLNGRKFKRADKELLDDGDMLQVTNPKWCHLLQTKEKKDDLGHKFNRAPWSGPLLFVPEYLDVNYGTRSVVFLRNPQSQPGRVEIPNPYPPSVMLPAFEYYVRRVKKRNDKRENMLRQIR